MKLFIYLFLKCLSYFYLSLKRKIIWLAARSTILTDLYPVFIISTLWLNKKKKIEHSNSVAEKKKCIH